MKTKQAALIPAPQQTGLTKALTLKGEIIAYHKAATSAAEEAMENLFQCGRLLEDVKAVLKVAKSTTFGEWVEQFCGFSERSAQCYCKLYQDLRDSTKAQRAALFNKHQSQRAVSAFLTDQRKPADPDPQPAKPKPAPAPPVVQGELVDDQDEPDDLDTAEPTAAEILGTAAPAEPIDRGRCPNCAGTKWTEDEDGAFCKKCNHPWGEPTGGVDEQRIADQRSKTIKTAEALLRAFDDLHHLLPKPEHGDAEKTCKRLVKVARAWK